MIPFLSIVLTRQPGLTRLVVLIFTLQPWASHVWAAQELSRDQLASIHRLRCTFSVSGVGSWNAGQPQARINAAGVLSLQIDAIDSQDGSARMSSVGISDAHIVARISERSLHFLETDVTGSLSVTTVFAQQTREGRLKAVHSRTSFLPVELPGFSSEPTVSQFYGECEIAR